MTNLIVKNFVALIMNIFYCPKVHTTILDIDTLKSSLQSIKIFVKLEFFRNILDVFFVIVYFEICWDNSCLHQNSKNVYYLWLNAFLVS